MTLRAVLKDLCPPVLPRLVSRWRHGRIVYRAGFADWASALAASDGYDDPAIVSRVVDATDAVLRGEAVAERDGVRLAHAPPPFHLLTPLLSAALQNDGRLTVLDVGGALGTLYRQCRPFMAGVRSLRWQVVEQPAFADIGRMRYATDELSFHGSPDEAHAVSAPDVVLLSSVLQFLPPDAALLGYLKHCTARYLVLDRTPFSSAPSDVLYVQDVPASIYAASYPMRALSRPRWLEDTVAGWSLVHESACAEGTAVATDGSRFDYRYQMLERTPC
jgi:putative methyltransferase (TIGR04325 family)